MEALCPPHRRSALFCLYLVHVTKGAESKSDEQELLARMRVRSRTRSCMRRRTDGADAGRQALLASRLEDLKAWSVAASGLWRSSNWNWDDASPSWQSSTRQVPWCRPYGGMFKLFTKA
ncbi:hypothetical protein BGZ57DRAFT_871257 [Hyaloscypha finlandica]|nr:hypothetical protein BGZ57DRAFT_871257 [Hyaloscypha finlandica]